MPNKCGLFMVISFALTTPLWVREKMCLPFGGVEKKSENLDGDQLFRHSGFHSRAVVG